VCLCATYHASVFVSKECSEGELVPFDFTQEAMTDRNGPLGRRGTVGALRLRFAGPSPCANGFHFSLTVIRVCRLKLRRRALCLPDHAAGSQAHSSRDRRLLWPGPNFARSLQGWARLRYPVSFWRLCGTMVRGTGVARAINRPDPSEFQR
jgi:hypothetical protein